MSDKAPHILSGEEALDDYFTALLDEEWNEQPEGVASGTSEQAATGAQEQAEKQAVQEEGVSESKDGKAKESAVKVPELQTQLHAGYNASYNEVEYADLDAPDLDDIQKLLDKLESLNNSTDADIETILDTESEIAVVADEQAEVTPVEEIQEWDVSALPDEAVAEATVVEPDAAITTELASDEVMESEELVSEDTQTEPVTAPGASLSENWESTQRGEDFQVLYFDVNGVTFAVPLDELGGIHRIGEMSHLIGRPAWYLGLQTNKEEQLDVVDTAKWVMSDRLIDDSYKEAYQYVVMLGESKWGLASTQLKGTELLNTEKVRWREQAGKRPWLAGMVKEKMCALIHVEAMISMLNAGLDVKALN
jgi:purine-binding chemotaxis protein CheW